MADAQLPAGNAAAQIPANAPPGGAAAGHAAPAALQAGAQREKVFMPIFEAISHAKIVAFIKKRLSPSAAAAAALDAAAPLLPALHARAPTPLDSPSLRFEVEQVELVEEDDDISNDDAADGALPPPLSEKEWKDSMIAALRAQQLPAPAAAANAAAVAPDAESASEKRDKLIEELANGACSTFATPPLVRFAELGAALTNEQVGAPSRTDEADFDRASLVEGLFSKANANAPAGDLKSLTSVINSELDALRSVLDNLHTVAAVHACTTLADPAYSSFKGKVLRQLVGQVWPDDDVKMLVSDTLLSTSNASNTIKTHRSALRKLLSDVIAPAFTEHHNVIVDHTNVLVIEVFRHFAHQCVYRLARLEVLFHLNNVSDELAKVARALALRKCRDTQVGLVARLVQPFWDEKLKQAKKELILSTNIAANPSATPPAPEDKNHLNEKKISSLVNAGIKAAIPSIVAQIRSSARIDTAAATTTTAPRRGNRGRGRGGQPSAQRGQQRHNTAGRGRGTSVPPAAAGRGRGASVPSAAPSRGRAAPAAPPAPPPPSLPTALPAPALGKSKGKGKGKQKFPPPPPSAPAAKAPSTAQPTPAKSTVAISSTPISQGTRAKAKSKKEKEKGNGTAATAPGKARAAKP